MEILTIVGKREVNFKDDQGKVIDGISFYFTMEADGVTGVMTGKLFLSRERCNRLDKLPGIGEKVAVVYDRYGKPTEFRPI